MLPLERGSMATKYPKIGHQMGLVRYSKGLSSVPLNFNNRDETDRSGESLTTHLAHPIVHE